MEPLHDERSREELLLEIERLKNELALTKDGVHGNIHETDIYKEIFAQVCEGMSIHSVVTDENGQPCDYINLAVNNAFLNITGLKAEQIVGRRLCESIPERMVIWTPHFKEVALTRKPKHVELYSSIADKHFSVFMFFLEPDILINVFQDASPRRKMEIMLSQSQATQNTILQAAPIGILLVHDRVFTWVNDRLTLILGYSTEELIGKSTRLLYYCDDEFIRVGREMYMPVEEQGIGSMNSLWKRKDGTPIDVYMRSAAIDRNDMKAGVIVTVIDITEKKRQDDKLKASLLEKEILLKEVHHRVKNNMQTITSLLRLQGNRYDTEEIETFVQESLNRIRSMALIHEKLYQSKDFIHIDMQSYIYELCNKLIRTYAVQGKEIIIDFQIEEGPIGIGTATSCGLILNELVSNSLRHAFPDRNRGQITVTFKKNRDNLYQLVVHDDGIGLSNAIDIRNTETMGFQLISMLVEDQLEGTIDLDTSKGTEFSILLKSGLHMDNAEG